MKKKNFKAVELNRLDENTISNIRLWRNAEFVRKQSFNKHEITEQEHANYIKKLKEDPNRGIFVFYLDDEPFAVYNYNINPLNNVKCPNCGLCNYVCPSKINIKVIDKEVQHDE